MTMDLVRAKDYESASRLPTQLSLDLAAWRVDFEIQTYRTRFPEADRFLLLYRLFEGDGVGAAAEVCYTPNQLPWLKREIENFLKIFASRDSSKPLYVSAQEVRPEDVESFLKRLILLIDEAASNNECVFAFAE